MGNFQSSVVIVARANLNTDINSTLNSSYNGTDDLCLKTLVRSQDNLILQTGAQLAVAFLMLGLGCTTEFKLMWKYIKTPKQIITGLVLQLVFLPLWGFSLSQILVMSEAETMGAIIQTSCPGGIYSNIASYWLDGDMDLSIVLTSLSTILAIGTLPFWLFVLPKINGIRNTCLEIPFNVLGFTVLGVIGPVIAGLLIKWKFPKVAFVLSKVCSIIGSIVVLTGALFIAIFQGPYLLPNLYWKTLLFCIIFPLIATVCGYLATRVPWVNFTVAARRTVAIETAMQNSALGMTIVLSSYDISNSKYFGPLIIIPFVYGFLQISSTVLSSIVYLVTKCTGHCIWLHPIAKISNETERDLECVSNHVFENKESDDVSKMTMKQQNNM